jgi:hypothetical protein
MKPNDPTGKAAAEARAAGPRQRVRDLPAGRLPLTRTPSPGNKKEES